MLAIPSTAVATLILLRHGQSIWNGADARFTGWTDVPLTVKGRVEAVAAGQLLRSRGFRAENVDVAFTSDLQRAHETTELALASMAGHEQDTWSSDRIRRDARLNERHYGNVQGLFKNDLEAELCCSVERGEPKNIVSWSDKLMAAWRFTFVDLVGDITKWLLIGLGCAALIKTLVPQEFLVHWGDGFIAFMVMAAIGVPMYICATASTPIAAGLLFSGVSPGAVLVFMLVGPATNIATVALVRSELGKRALCAYLGSVVGVSFAFGYLTNALASSWGLAFVARPEVGFDMSHGWIAYTASLVLAALMLRSLLSSWRPAKMA